jgi:AAA family ATP:ADP antiporter
VNNTQGSRALHDAGIRFLSFFTKIYPCEIKLTITLFSSVFLLLTAYYLAKPVRESWLAVSVIADLSKLEVKAYSGCLQSVVLMALIPLYGYFFDRMPRGKLLVWVNVIFIMLFPVFWLLRPGYLMDQMPYAGVIFYIWIGIFAVSVLAQFWAFAADLYNEMDGKRLFPLIALGASSGAVIGSMVANLLVKNMAMDSYSMLLVAPLPLLLATALIYYVDREETAAEHEHLSGDDPPQEDPRSAIRIILGNRYLIRIALFVFLLNWVTTNGENILFAAVQDSIANSYDFAAMAVEEKNRIVQDETTNFYSRIYFWVNLIGMLLQAFVVSRLLLYGGIAGVLLIPPFVSLAGYGVMSTGGNIGMLTVAKTAENATNYSVTNTARHILWLPVARESLYKAKAAIDTLCVRLADGLAAITVIVGSRFFHASITHFFILNIALILIWLLIAVMILQERRQWNISTEKALA